MNLFSILAVFASASLASAAQSSFVSTAPTSWLSGSSGPGSHLPVVDDFESYSVFPGSAEVTGSALIADTTVTVTGQGPGLVADGCAYSAGTLSGASLQWNGDGWFGTSTKTLFNSSGTTLTLLYDAPQDDIAFDLDAFVGFGADSATVSGYDAGGLLVFTSAPILLLGGAPVNFSYVGAPVKEIRIEGSGLLGWSPIIDNHAYVPGPGGGLLLGVSYPCPSPVTVGVAGAAPFANVAFANGPAGSFTIPNGGCAGTSLGISGPTLLGIFGADAAGSLSLTVFLPAGFCGTTLQVVDLTSCTASNPVVL